MSDEDYKEIIWTLGSIGMCCAAIEDLTVCKMIEEKIYKAAAILEKYKPEGPS